MALQAVAQTYAYLIAHGRTDLWAAAVAISRGKDFSTVDCAEDSSSLLCHDPSLTLHLGEQNLMFGLLCNIQILAETAQYRGVALL